MNFEPAAAQLKEYVALKREQRKANQLKALAQQKKCTAFDTQIEKDKDADDVDVEDQIDTMFGRDKTQKDKNNQIAEKVVDDKRNLKNTSNMIESLQDNIKNLIMLRNKEQ